MTASALHITLENGRVFMRCSGQEFDLPYVTIRNGLMRERWAYFYLQMIAERQGRKRCIEIQSPLSRRSVRALIYGPSIMRKKIRRAL